MIGAGTLQKKENKPNARMELFGELEKVEL